MQKYIEIKSYDYLGIKICVKINYMKGQISIVEKQGDTINQFPDKKFVFVGRELEYMNGWQNILDALKYAIGEAKKELEDYQKEKDDLVTDVLLEATDLVKKRNFKKTK